MTINHGHCLQAPTPKRTANLGVFRRTCLDLDSPIVLMSSKKPRERWVPAMIAPTPSQSAPPMLRVHVASVQRAEGENPLDSQNQVLEAQQSGLSLYKKCKHDEAAVL